MLFPNIQRRWIFYLWCWDWFLLAILLIYPISYGILRFLTVILLFLVWLGAIVIFWQRLPIKVAGFVVGAIALLISLLPGQPINPDILRSYYVQGLIYYEGTRYVWGGENKFGIDCSGLVREGLVKANLMYGLRFLNPQTIREGVSIWWYDSSAVNLKTGYLNKTQVLFAADSINQIDAAKIQVGDFAVTKDGVHTLAYIGNNVWIEADPNYQKVIKVQVPEPNNPWFNVPVYLVRWRQLEIPEIPS